MKTKKIQYDYLKNHPSWIVCQHKDMFKINTDTILLGEFLFVSPNESLFDVGTNNGALLLYGAMQGCKKLTGIDINKKAISIAKKTLSKNHIKAKLIAKDFRKYKSKKKYDVIVTNPPYFEIRKDHVQCDNQYREMARNEQFLPLSDLIKGVCGHLNENGRIYMIHRPNRLKDIEDEFLKNGFVISKLRYVYASYKKNPISILILAKKQEQELENRIQDDYILNP